MLERYTRPLLLSWITMSLLARDSAEELKRGNG